MSAPLSHCATAGSSRRPRRRCCPHHPRERRRCARSGRRKCARRRRRRRRRSRPAANEGEGIEFFRQRRRTQNAAAAAAFFSVGDTWTESTPTFTQITATLTIVGGDADIDNFLLNTRSNVQDLQSAVIRLKAKAVQQKFEDTFLNGDTAVDSKSFDGIDKLTTGGQIATMGANGATLTLAKLDELIDLVKLGGPDLLLMSKRTRRTLNNLARTSGTFLQTDRDQFGQMVQFYDGVPIAVSDYISDAKTVGTSTDCSTVYAMQFGEGPAGQQKPPPKLSCRITRRARASSGTSAPPCSTC